LTEQKLWLRGQHGPLYDVTRLYREATLSQGCGVCIAQPALSSMAGRAVKIDHTDFRPFASVDMCMRLPDAVGRLIDANVFVEATVHPFALVKPLEAFIILGHKDFG
jgi:hypothetical protein